MRAGVAAAVDADVIVFLDADLVGLGPHLLHHVLDLRTDLGPTLRDRPEQHAVALRPVEHRGRLAAVATHQVACRFRTRSLLAQRGLEHLGTRRFAAG